MGTMPTALQKLVPSFLMGRPTQQTEVQTQAIWRSHGRAAAPLLVYLCVQFCILHGCASLSRFSSCGCLLVMPVSLD